MRRGFRGGVAGVVATLACVAPARAAMQDGWQAVHAVDAVTDAIRNGAVYQSGGDRLLVICTHNKTGPWRFWIEVQTDSHLGRRGTRRLTYRIGDEPPTTSNWQYTPREAAPVWPLEDKHIVQRILKGDAKQLVLRLTGADGDAHDVTAPIDPSARELMSKTLAECEGAHA